MATQPLNAPVTQEFGENPASYRPFGLLGHEGRDYGAFNGTPVRAIRAGWVGVSASSYGNYGNAVGIRHADGSGVFYAHLQSFAVNYGQFVNEGQLIGYSNNTGNSSGPHLHITYQKQFLQNLNNGYWGGSDPRELFTGEPMADDYITQINVLNARLGQTQAQVEGERAKNAQLTTQVTNLVNQLTQTQIQVEQLAARPTGGPITKEQVINYLNQKLS